MTICRYPSLELNWLTRDLRQLPMPAVIYHPGLAYGGLYCPPSHEFSIVEGIELDPHRGVIIVGDWGDELPIACNLAHEFRHHWQWWNGWTYDGVGLNPDKSYSQQMAEYFGRSRSEADALRYEFRRAPCDESHWRLSVSAFPD